MSRGFIIGTWRDGGRGERERGRGVERERTRERTKRGEAIETRNGESSGISKGSEARGSGRNSRTGSRGKRRRVLREAWDQRRRHMHSRLEWMPALYSNLKLERNRLQSGLQSPTCTSYKIVDQGWPRSY